MGFTFQLFQYLNVEICNFQSLITAADVRVPNGKGVDCVDSKFSLFETVRDTCVSRLDRDIMVIYGNSHSNGLTVLQSKSSGSQLNARPSTVVPVILSITSLASIAEQTRMRLVFVVNAALRISIAAPYRSRGMLFLARYFSNLQDAGKYETVSLQRLQGHVVFHFQLSSR